MEIFALSTAKKIKATPKKSLATKLQGCYSPQTILDNVACHISPQEDPQGTLSCLILNRLSKQLVHKANIHEANIGVDTDVDFEQPLYNVVQSLASSDWTSFETLETIVDGTKAASVLSRLRIVPAETWNPLLEKWKEVSYSMIQKLEPHHISGLKWAFDCFQLNEPQLLLPTAIQEKYSALTFPFRIQPAFLKDVDTLSLEELRQQVDFRVETIRTASDKLVNERRQTAWVGDDNVKPFEYSGKVMETKPMPPIVLQVRDLLYQNTGEYYDGCLLNLYPDGGSAMRFHIDPDQGRLWGYETVVVSVGATRKFAFREIPSHNSNPAHTHQHIFTLMHGDITEMFADCQQRYQHTVKTADNKNEKAARSSLVFKKTLQSVSKEESSSTLQ